MREIGLGAFFGLRSQILCHFADDSVKQSSWQGLLLGVLTACLWGIGGPPGAVDALAGATTVNPKNDYGGNSSGGFLELPVGVNDYEREPNADGEHA